MQINDLQRIMNQYLFPHIKLFERFDRTTYVYVCHISMFEILDSSAFTMFQCVNKNSATKTIIAILQNTETFKRKTFRTNFIDWKK